MFVRRIVVGITRQALRSSASEELLVGVATPEWWVCLVFGSRLRP